MTEMYITWQEFITNFPNINKESITMLETDKKYILSVLLNDNSKIEIIISKTDPDELNDLNDFEKNYKPYIINTGLQINKQGYTVISPGYGTPIETPEWNSYICECNPNSITFTDIKITDEIRLAQGEYVWCNNSLQYIDDENDIIEFSLIDKDDVLGLFSTYGLVVGENILELGKFIKNHYIEHFGRFTFVPEVGLLPVAKGLYFRVAFTNSGANVQKFKTTYQWYK